MKRRYGGFCRTGRHALTPENCRRDGSCRPCETDRQRQRRHAAEEPCSPWPGLAYVLEHGLPGYPPPRLDDTTDAVIRRRARQTVDFADLA